jgi:hypothetical protein
MSEKATAAGREMRDIGPPVTIRRAEAPREGVQEAKERNREPMRVTVRDAWDSYVAGVMPPDAPPDQIRECRRAFYAGFWAMLNINIGIGEDGVTEAMGVFVLESLVRECRAFNADVQQGRA